MHVSLCVCKQAHAPALSCMIQYAHRVTEGATALLRFKKPCQRLRFADPLHARLPAVASSVGRCVQRPYPKQGSLGLSGQTTSWQAGRACIDDRAQKKTGPGKKWLSDAADYRCAITAHWGHCKNARALHQFMEQTAAADDGRLHSVFALRCCSALFLSTAASIECLRESGMLGPVYAWVRRKGMKYARRTPQQPTSETEHSRTVRLGPTNSWELCRYSECSCREQSGANARVTTIPSRNQREACRRKQQSVLGEAEVSASGAVHCFHPACSRLHSLAPVHTLATTRTPSACNVPHPQHMYLALPLPLLLRAPGHTLETPQTTAIPYCTVLPPQNPSTASPIRPTPPTPELTTDHHNYSPHTPSLSTHPIGPSTTHHPFYPNAAYASLHIHITYFQG